MYSILTTLITRLEDPRMTSTGVIDWGSPVPSFGNIGKSKVVSLGLNPSNREFLDNEGYELTGPMRRFHSLSSLGINSWAEINALHLKQIIETCFSYFLSNPYDTWFRKLDQIISSTGYSYYDSINQACHLDIIPYATEKKWTDLTTIEKQLLIDISGDALARLLEYSSVRMIILNGISVIKHFEKISKVNLEKEELNSIKLNRKNGRHIKGYIYKGYFNQLSGINLDKKILAIGFNHNIQSSFGITNNVIYELKEWVSIIKDEVFQ